MQSVSASERGWPTSEQELLLRASLQVGEEALRAWRAWQAVVDIDTLDIGSQGMLPLLHANLTAQGVTDSALAWYKGFRRRAWYLNQLRFAHMIPVLRALREAGIRRIMVLKGASLIVGGYYDFGQRPMDDFDFAVPSEHAVAATAMLVRWGWQPKSPMPRLHGWDFRDANDWKLDLHWYTLHDCSWPGADDEFWAGAVPAQVEDVPVVVLQHTDMLLHVLAHGVRWQAATPLRWIADAMAVIRTAGEEIDWDRLIRAARTRRLHPLAREGLRYLKEKLAAPVPQKVLRGLRGSTPSSTPKRPITLRRVLRWVGRRAYHSIARRVAS